MPFLLRFLCLLLGVFLEAESQAKEDEGAREKEQEEEEERGEREEKKKETGARESKKKMGESEEQKKREEEAKRDGAEEETDKVEKGEKEHDDPVAFLVWGAGQGEAEEKKELSLVFPELDVPGVAQEERKQRRLVKEKTG